MSFLDRILPPNIKRLEAKSDVDGLIEALRHKNSEIRHGAAGALGRIGGQPAVAPLVVALKDSSTKVRLSAIKALGNLQDDEALDPLLSQLADETRAIRSTAHHALANFGSNQRIAAALDKIRRTQAIEWWATVDDDNKTCDVCTESIKRDGGMMLETEEIVASKSYLEHAFRMKKLMSPVGTGSFDTKVAGLAPFAQSLLDQVGQTVEAMSLKADIEKVTTPWLVCDDCIAKHFN